MKKETNRKLTPALESKLRKKIRGLVENMLREGSNYKKITQELTAYCEQVTDTLDPSEQAIVYTNVAEFLQKRALYIKQNS